MANHNIGQNIQFLEYYILTVDWFIHLQETWVTSFYINTYVNEAVYSQSNTHGIYAKTAELWTYFYKYITENV